jgi:hypothetical protein
MWATAGVGVRTYLLGLSGFIRSRPTPGEAGEDRSGKCERTRRFAGRLSVDADGAVGADDNAVGALHPAVGEEAQAECPR